MKRLFVAFVFALAMLAPSLGAARDYALGGLAVTQPWARFTAPGAANGAAYLVIRNNGAEPDRLIGAATPRAAKVELHESAMEGEVMTMRPREAIEIKPSETVRFEPGGLHIMLFGLSAPLKEGEAFPLTLRFEKAGALTIEVEVRRGGDMKMDGHDGMMKMDDHRHTD